MLGEIDKMEQAIILMHRTQSKVFYSSMIIPIIRIETNKINTIGVWIENGRIYMGYNPKYIEERTFAEIIALLEHEILHLILSHLFRRKYRDKNIWNIACDLAINQFIENLPKGALYPKLFDFEENLTAEEYYNLLMSNSRIIKGLSIIDNHEGWSKSENATDSEIGRSLIKKIAQEAYNEHIKSRGTLPRDIEQQIQNLLKPAKIPWKVLLRQYIGKTVKCGYKYSWKRISKRLGDMFKGKIIERNVKIAIAIDTSASIDDDDFKEFISEIKMIQLSYKNDITIMECDATIQKIYSLHPYAQLDTKFKGRGGTDYEPVFNKIEENLQYKPDLLIYFTDFYCDFPKNKPNYDVLWVVSSNGNTKTTPPFGSTIYITKEKEE